MSNKKNYFDKFINDQIKRAEANKLRRKEHLDNHTPDQKRNLLRRYRELSANLIVRNKKNG